MHHRLICIICITAFPQREPGLQTAAQREEKLMNPACLKTITSSLSSEGKFKERASNYISKGNEIQTHTHTHSLPCSHLHTHTNTGHTYPVTL